MGRWIDDDYWTDDELDALAEQERQDGLFELGAYNPPSNRWGEPLDDVAPDEPDEACVVLPMFDPMPYVEDDQQLFVRMPRRP